MAELSSASVVFSLSSCCLTAACCLQFERILRPLAEHTQQHEPKVQVYHATEDPEDSLHLHIYEMSVVTDRARCCLLPVSPSLSLCLPACSATWMTRLRQSTTAARPSVVCLAALPTCGAALSRASLSPR
jgi:hypothetical protein